MLSRFCKNAFKDFFFFSKGERNGICVMVSLVTLMFSVNFCLPIQSPEERKISEKFRIDSVGNVSYFSSTFSDKIYEKNGDKNSNYNDKQKKKSCDMNLECKNEKIDEDNLCKKELIDSKKMIVDSRRVTDENNIKRNDGKIFEKSKAIYERNSYNKYDKNGVGESYKKFDYDTVRVYVNIADTTELKRLRGIGSILSARIVKYRDKIGGFKSLDQLQKIYGLSEETYRSILPHLILDK